MIYTWCRSVLHRVAFHLYFCSADTSKPTIKQLTIELYKNLASEWNLIGILLGISDGELNTISQREHGDPQKCLVAMLRVWLNQTNPPASWPEIANVVEFTGNKILHNRLGKSTARTHPPTNLRSLSLYYKNFFFIAIKY